MPTVYFTTTASSYVDITDEELKEAADASGIEVDDVDIIELAWEKWNPPTLCAQCSGWGGDQNLDISGEWEPDENVEV